MHVPIAQERLNAYRELLANRDFRRWLWSSLISSLGDWVGLFALQVLIVSLADPGSRLALFGLGGLMMARLLPSVLFGPAAGLLADRYNRKRLMIACDVTRGALFVWVAFAGQLWLLFALTVVIESASLLYLSAKNAALPVIVEADQLPEANQLTLLITYGPLPFGAGVAALLSWLSGILSRLGVVDIDGTTGALLLNAATFLLAAALILRLRSVSGARGRGDQQPGKGPVATLREAAAFIRDRPILRALILGVTGVFFGAGVLIALGPEFVRTDLNRSESDWYGLMTTVGVGLLLGLTAAPLLASRWALRHVFSLSLVSAAVAAVLTAVLPTYRPVQAMGFTLGVLAGTAFVSGYTLLQETSSDETRGRTFAAFFTGTRIAMFAALGIGPFVAGTIGRWTVGLGVIDVTVSGVRATLVAGGLVAAVSAVMAARPMLRVDQDDVGS